MPTAPVISDDLLAPISEQRPGGEDLRPTPEWDKIKEARRSDEAVAQGAWKLRDAKTANWPLVERLASDALAHKSKDLQIAVWLTEANIKLHGFAGLRDSLRLVRELLTRFWDGLYPPIEDGDLDFRAGPLLWLNDKMPEQIREIPITIRSDSGEDYSYRRYMEARRVGSEQDLINPSTQDVDEEKRLRRDGLLADGLISPEMWEAAVQATRRAPYEVLYEDFDQACKELQELDRLLEEKFGSDAPPLNEARSTLEECRIQTERILQRKREEEPDPAPAVEAAGAGAPAEVAVAPGAVRIGLPAEPQDRDDALRRIASVAAYLRHNDPYNPASYLLTRAVRWGELRNGGKPPNASLCAAPGSEVRQKLRQLYLDAQWNDLLEQSEAAAAGEAGRAWLDVHRYSITALTNLGYENAAEAIKSELRLLLQDYPELPQTNLLDDTAAANQETVAWLETVSAPLAPAAQPETTAGEKDPWEQAQKIVRSGRLQQGLAEMARLTATEPSGRARFHRKLQLAEMFLSLKREPLAIPILEELAEQIERLQLESWESADLVGRVWRKLYGCYKSAETGSPEAERAAKLFARLCRLDPSQAFACVEE